MYGVSSWQCAVCAECGLYLQGHGLSACRNWLKKVGEVKKPVCVAEWDYPCPQPQTTGRQFLPLLLPIPSDMLTNSNKPNFASPQLRAVIWDNGAFHMHLLQPLVNGQFPHIFAKKPSLRLAPFPQKSLFTLHFLLIGKLIFKRCYTFQRGISQLFSAFMCYLRLQAVPFLQYNPFWAFCELACTMYIMSATAHILMSITKFLVCEYQMTIIWSEWLNLNCENLFLFFSSSGSAAVLTRSSTGSSLKRPDTTESLNSSMSNGTNDAGKGPVWTFSKELLIDNLRGNWVNICRIIYMARYLWETVYVPFLY